MKTELTPEQLAGLFHKIYEEKALINGWKTQEKTRVNFDDLPIENKRTMIETCEEILSLLTKQEEQKPATDRPEGLYGKYIISRSDGTPIDPENRYFILKLEGPGDPVHIAACTKAVLCYAEEIRHHLPELANDLFRRYEPFAKYNSFKQKEQPKAKTDAENFYDKHGGFVTDDRLDAFRFAEAFHEAASQPLKQANAELKDALSEVMQVVNEEEEFDPDHVKKWNKILSKHEKQ